MAIADQYNKINNRFYDKTKINFVPGSSIDCFSMATAEGIQDAYNEIDKNKYPYFLTDLSGKDIDSLGTLLRIPREANEKDDNYLYRIINWELINESTNRTAIDAALLNLTYASHAEYVPLTYGCGTASVYIIPNTYDNDTIENSIKEVKEKLSTVVSPSSYIDYIIPKIRKVKLIVNIESDSTDIKAIKSLIQNNIQAYINNIPIKQYLSIGSINKIGLNTTGISYFNVENIFIDDIENINLQILQTIDSKFLYDEIIWE